MSPWPPAVWCNPHGQQGGGSSAAHLTPTLQWPPLAQHVPQLPLLPVAHWQYRLRHRRAGQCLLRHCVLLADRVGRRPPRLAVRGGCEVVALHEGHSAGCSCELPAAWKAFARAELPVMRAVRPAAAAGGVLPRRHRCRLQQCRLLRRRRVLGLADAQQLRGQHCRPYPPSARGTNSLDSCECGCCTPRAASSTDRGLLACAPTSQCLAITPLWTGKNRWNIAGWASQHLRQIQTRFSEVNFCRSEL